MSLVLRPKQPKVLLWSMSRAMWWRHNNNGYTTVIDDAGWYPLQEAALIVAQSQRGGVPDEIIVTEETAAKPLPEWMFAMLRDWDSRRERHWVPT